MPCHGPQDLDALVFKCQNDDASGRSFLQLICAFLRSVVLCHIGGDLSPDGQHGSVSRMGGGGDKANSDDTHVARETRQCVLCPNSLLLCPISA